MNRLAFFYGRQIRITRGSYPLAHLVLRDPAPGAPVLSAVDQIAEALAEGRMLPARSIAAWI